MSQRLVPCSSCGKKHYQGSQAQSLCQRVSGDHSSPVTTFHGDFTGSEVRTSAECEQQVQDIAEEYIDIVPEDATINPIGNAVYLLEKTPESEWSTNEHRSVDMLTQVYEMLTEDDSSASVDAAQDIVDMMPNSPRRSSFSSRDPYQRDERCDWVKSLAESIIAYHAEINEGDPEITPRIRNTRLLGLDQAQLDEYQERNNYQSLSDSRITTLYGSDTVDVLDDARDLIYATGLQDSRDDAFSPLRRTERVLSHQDAYLAQIFPDRELRVHMENLGIDNVSVSSFANGRENGLVYTVIQPDGHARSFSVYEHRNTDSIVINGCTDWNGEDLPYAADSKYAYFAEIPHKEFDQAADALCYFMASAQRGELEDDDYLARNSSKVDHVTRLSEDIPGFKEWYEVNYPAEAAMREGDSDEDVLRRLDF